MGDKGLPYFILKEEEFMRRFRWFFVLMVAGGLLSMGFARACRGPGREEVENGGHPRAR